MVVGMNGRAKPLTSSRAMEKREKENGTGFHNLLPGMILII
jgi:hypothetical protein